MIDRWIEWIGINAINSKKLKTSLKIKYSLDGFQLLWSDILVVFEFPTDQLDTGDWGQEGWVKALMLFKQLDEQHRSQSHNFVNTQED